MRPISNLTYIGRGQWLFTLPSGLERVGTVVNTSAGISLTSGPSSFTRITIKELQDALKNELPI